MNDYIKKIITDINSICSPSYLVGGSVRDYLLGKEPKDYDFATPLTPEQIESNIKAHGHKAYGIGKRFGTIGMKYDKTMIEITTYRQEKYSDGNRKPEVSFVRNLEEDLSRRDFTINALAMDMNGEISDFNGGKEDLQQNIIRCVGKTNDRFKEDPLRMLRAGRFASQLGFLIHEDIYDMCKQLNYKILDISRERWMQELDKILISDNASIGLNFLMNTKLINYMLPELSLQYNYGQDNEHHTLDLWNHTLSVVSHLPSDATLRWAGLLHDIAKPFTRTEKNGQAHYYKHDLIGAEIVQKYASYLHWSNDRRYAVANLVANHMCENSPLREADLQSRG